MKALFIPLKAEFYDDFVAGVKDTEYRRLGRRWNENTCRIGREVVISRGYGKQARRTGKIVGFESSREPTRTEAWHKCYGDSCHDLAACIKIKLDTVA